MRTQNFLSSLVIAGSLLAGGVFIAPAIAQTAKPAATAEAGKDLMIPQIHAKLAAAGYTKIDKLERERGEFEVRATDKDGKRVKLRVDAQTGDVISARQKDERGERRSGSDDSKAAK